MTKYYLHGGSTGVQSQKNKNFFKKVCENGNKILIFPFGLDDENQGFDDYKNKFLSNIGNQQLFIEYASIDKEILINQIINHDILFFSGGKPSKHFEVINQIENFKELIKDKTIAGTSGGAIMRSNIYYSSSAEHIGKGNNFIPIKIIAHRLSDKNPGLSREERSTILQKNGENLKIYKIKEQEFVEFII